MSIVDYSRATKDVKRAPKHIKAKFLVWVATVELQGIRHARTLNGYHDEPLKGDRKGERSIRLNN